MIKPLADRLVIKPIEEKQKTVAGLVIPDSAKEKPQEGEVVAVGPGVKNDDGTVKPLDVKKGDKVIYSKYSGTELTIDGTEHLIVNESDVLAIV
jgi:chaperonin GroES